MVILMKTRQHLTLTLTDDFGFVNWFQSHVRQKLLVLTIHPQVRKALTTQVSAKLHFIPHLRHLLV